MNNFFKIILRYHFHILFIVLEIVACLFIFKHNSYQNSVFFGTLSDVNSVVDEQVYMATKFFDAPSINDELIEENVELRNKLARITDSLFHIPVGYNYYSAHIINSTWNRNKNYMVINKGRIDSIREDNGICSGDKVLGIVVKCSDHYSIAIPLINTNLKISGMVKNSSYYGSLQWDGADYRFSYLYDIPDHVNVAIGDTVVTTGFSSVFPEGKLLGVVDSVIRQESSFNKLRIKLAADFKHLGQINIIANNSYMERKELENEFFKNE
ncbi:MAG: rod shape-determining protein MreC [Bacteroidales bacterium]|nr:rod shape-determining protein MreC [Bacteroidales bacterium]